MMARVELLLVRAGERLDDCGVDKCSIWGDHQLRELRNGCKCFNAKMKTMRIEMTRRNGSKWIKMAAGASKDTPSTLSAKVPEL
jgi:hypothetical protein